MINNYSNNSIIHFCVPTFHCKLYCIRRSYTVYTGCTRNHWLLRIKIIMLQINTFVNSVRNIQWNLLVLQFLTKSTKVYSVKFSVLTYLWNFFPVKSSKSFFLFLGLTYTLKQWKQWKGLVPYKTYIFSCLPELRNFLSLNHISKYECISINIVMHLCHSELKKCTQNRNQPKAMLDYIKQSTYHQMHLWHLSRWHYLASFRWKSDGYQVLDFFSLNLQAGPSFEPLLELVLPVSFVCVGLMGKASWNESDT